MADYWAVRTADLKVVHSVVNWVATKVVTREKLLDKPSADWWVVQ